MVAFRAASCGANAGSGPRKEGLMRSRAWALSAGVLLCGLGVVVGQEEGCVTPCAVFAGPDPSGHATVDLPTPDGGPITVFQSDVPLQITECGALPDCNLAVFVPSSPVATPARVTFSPNLCPQTGLPTTLRFTVEGHSGSYPTLVARDVSSAVVDVGSVPPGAPLDIELSHPAGIASVDILGTEICVLQICWGCCAFDCELVADYLSTPSGTQLPVVTFGRITVHSAVEGATTELLDVSGCGDGGTMGVGILSSKLVVASPPATIEIEGACADGQLPVVVVVTMKSDNGELRALDASGAVRDTADLSLGVPPPALPANVFRNWELEYSGGIAKIEVYGTQHCVTRVCWWCPASAPRFVRGDCNADGKINIADAVMLLNYMFLKGPPCSCADAGDVDDLGSHNVTDAIRILCWLFSSTCLPPSPPTPVDGSGVPSGTYDSARSCGVDPTADILDCKSFATCP